MRCPYCGAQESKVVDSRDVENSIRRRRECLNADCAGRFTTYERVQAVALYIVKKDGRREEFSREKLTAGLRKACQKLPLPAGAIDAASASIESTLYATNAPEIPSSALGELVMDQLRELNPVAYVRFASVYREFRDLGALREELDALDSDTRPAASQLPLLDDPALPPGTHLRLQPAAPNNRTRNRRRPVRPVQTPVPLAGSAQEQQKRRKAR